MIQNFLQRGSGVERVQLYKAPGKTRLSGEADSVPSMTCTHVGLLLGLGERYSIWLDNLYA